jgi:enoyl-CoA hydratase/carnithine racemase
METVKVRRLDPSGVVEIILNRPDALNAISTEHARAIAAVGAGLAADSTMRAVVVSSASEKAFCVGADLKERRSFTDDDLRRQRLHAVQEMRARQYAGDRTANTFLESAHRHLPPCILESNSAA